MVVVMKYILESFKLKKYWFLYLSLFMFAILKLRRGMIVEDEQAGGIWNILQIFLVFAGVMLIKKYHKKQIMAINTLFRFSFLCMVFAFFHMTTHPITSLSSWFYYFMILYAPFLLLVFYLVGYENGVNQYSLWLKVTFYILIYIFYQAATNYQLNYDNETIIMVADIYYALGLLPLVLANTKSTRSIIPLIVLFAAIIVSGKRGGFIAVVIVGLIYFFVDTKKRRNTTRTFILLLSFAAAIVIATYLVPYLDNYLGMHTIERLEASTEDKGSGRVDRWLLTYNAFLDSNFIDLITGHGFNAIYPLLGGRAHNDFFEILYNYGLIPLVFYIMFYVRLIKINIRMFHKNYPYAKYYLSSIAISILLSLVSFYVVEPTYITCGMFCMGIFIGDWKRFEKQLNK